MTNTATDLSFLFSGLTGARYGGDPDRFRKALALLAQYEADEVILKSEHKDLRTLLNDGFEAAWTELVSAPFLYAGRFQDLNEAETKLEHSLNRPECHTAQGYLRRVEAAEAAAGPMRDAMLKLLREIAPLAYRTEVIKAKIGKRQPSRTSKTAIAQAEREAKTMTCQCCARAILAETGTIAHHGYQRPGDGYQTASCPGAKYLPFEVSRDALGAYIERLRAHVERRSAYLARVKAEQVKLPFTYVDRSGCTKPWHQGVKRTIDVTRETIAAEFEAIKPLCGVNRSWPTFDDLKNATLARVDGDIVATKAEIAHQQRRYDGWTQTHQRQGYQWVALAGGGAG